MNYIMKLLWFMMCSVRDCNNDYKKCWKLDKAKWLFSFVLITLPFGQPATQKIEMLGRKCRRRTILISAQMYVCTQIMKKHKRHKNITTVKIKLSHIICLQQQISTIFTNIPKKFINIINLINFTENIFRDIKRCTAKL